MNRNAISNEPITTEPVGREPMTSPVPKYVTQGRAALLLGISEEELARISQESGLGHTERAGDHEETFYTYQELRKICQISTQHVN